MAMVDVVVVGYKSELYLPRLFDDLKLYSRLPYALHYWDNIGNPKSLSGAWNDGAAAGTAPFLAILNPDVCLSPGWDRKLVQVLEEHQNVGVAHARGIGRLPNHAVPTPEQMEALELEASLHPHVELLDYDVVGMDGLKFFVPMIRRVTWDTLRGMDERLRFIRAESEFYERVRRHFGQVVGVAHHVPAWHKVGASVRQAVDAGELDERYEHVLSDGIWDQIKIGALREWHLLTDQERADIRSNPLFNTIGRVKTTMKVHVIPRAAPTQMQRGR